ncbi:effector-associated constant component EACC1 [Actinoplanes sp. CA-054009]
MLIQITSSDDPSLHSLAEWLEADDFEASLGASGARPGAQGPLDLIDVILSNATAIAALLVSFAQWRSSKDHDEAPKITFKHGDVEITAEDADEETIQRVLKALGDAER